MAILDVTTAPYGAGGGGDDTAAIQRAVDAAKTGDTVLVPGGARCLINPIANSERLFYGSAVGIVLKSNIAFRVDGTLQAITVSPDHYVMLLADAANGLTITGKGQIVGDRDTHVAIDQAGQWGHGIALGASQDVTINGGLIISKCWGDGLTAIGTKALAVDHVTFDSCYRQNASLIDIDGASFTNCAFKNAGQTNLDLEPSWAGQSILNVKIANCAFANCATLFPIGSKKVHLGIGSEPGIGTFKGISVSACNWDLRQQPIWVHGTAGETGIPWWAYLLNVALYQGAKSDAYRFWGYPQSWSD